MVAKHSSWGTARMVTTFRRGFAHAHLGVLAVSFAVAATAAGCGSSAASDPVGGEPASPSAGPTDPGPGGTTTTQPSASSDTALAIQIGADLEVEAGKSAEIPFTLLRGVGIANARVVVEIEGLPSGVTLAAPVAVDGPGVSGKLVLAASASARQGSSPVTIVASAVGAPSSVRITTTLIVRGAPASVDESFATHGVATDPLGDATAGIGFIGQRLLPQPDGKVIVLADCGPRDQVLLGKVTGFCITRVDADGKRDLTFNGGTLIDLRSDAGRVWLGDAELLDDGKLLVAGWTSSQMLVLRRFNADGTPDSTFGTAGVSELPRAITGVAIPLSASLHILRRAGGLPHILFYFGSPVRPMVVRITAAGTLDPTYGTAGVGSVAATEQLYPCGYGIHNDDRVFGLGCGEIDASQKNRARFFQLTAAGQPDPTFGTAGLEDSTRRVYARLASRLVARATGELDAIDLTSLTFPISTFLFGVSADGRAADPHLTNVSNYPNAVTSLAVRADGSFFAVGNGIAHFGADGSYDPTFAPTPPDGHVRDLVPTGGRRALALTNSFTDHRVYLTRIWE